MRLSSQDVQIIRETILSFDPLASIFLFGSRTKDDRRGGDIDLLCLSARLGGEDGRRIRLRLQDKLGEQKIDLVLAHSPDTPFLRMIMKDVVPI